MSASKDFTDALETALNDLTGFTSRYTFQNFMDCLINAPHKSPEVLAFRKLCQQKLPGFFRERFTKSGARIGLDNLSKVQFQLFQALFRCFTDLPYPQDAHVNYLVQSSTGSGKTFAFVLAGLLNINPQKRQQQMVILAPTQELALAPYSDWILSILSDLYPTGGAQDIHVLSLVGSKVLVDGNEVSPTTTRPSECQIVVATYDQFMNKVTSGEVDPRGLETFIIDEADAIIYDTFIEKKPVDGIVDFCNKIVKALPRECKILLFSATFDDEVLERVEFCLKRHSRDITVRDIDDPAARAVRHKDATTKAADVTSSYFNVKIDVLLQKIIQINIECDPVRGGPGHEVFAYSKAQMNTLIHRCFAPTKSIIFLQGKERIKHCTDENLASNLEFCQFKQNGLRGKHFYAVPKGGRVLKGKARDNVGDDTAKAVDERKTTLSSFVRIDKGGEDCLDSVFSTDLLARGFDLPSLDIIVNYELPISYADKVDVKITAGSYFIEIKNGKAVLTVDDEPKNRKIIKRLDVGFVLAAGSKYFFITAKTGRSTYEVKQFDEPRYVPSTNNPKQLNLRDFADGFDFASICNSIDLVAYVVYDYTNYKHRIGRTGRFNNSGLVINLIDGSVEKEVYNHFHSLMLKEQEVYLDSTKINIRETLIKALKRGLSPDELIEVDRKVTEDKRATIIKSVPFILNEKKLSMTKEEFLMIGKEYSESTPYAPEQTCLCQPRGEKDKKFKFYKRMASGGSQVVLPGLDENVWAEENIAADKVKTPLRQYYHENQHTVASSAAAGGGGGGGAVARTLPKPPPASNDSLNSNSKSSSGGGAGVSSSSDSSNSSSNSSSGVGDQKDGGSDPWLAIKIKLGDICVDKEDNDAKITYVNAAAQAFGVQAKKVNDKVSELEKALNALNLSDLRSKVGLSGASNCTIVEIFSSAKGISMLPNTSDGDWARQNVNAILNYSPAPIRTDVNPPPIPTTTPTPTTTAEPVEEWILIKEALGDICEDKDDNDAKIPYVNAAAQAFAIESKKINDKIIAIQAAIAPWRTHKVVIAGELGVDRSASVITIYQKALKDKLVKTPTTTSGWAVFETFKEKYEESFDEL